MKQIIQPLNNVKPVVKCLTILKPLTLLAVLWLALLFTACSSEPAAPPTPTTAPTETATPTPALSDTETIRDTASVDPASLSAEDIVDKAVGVTTAVAERTPIPTPTPGIVDRVAVDIINQTGLAEATFLGLTAEDWIDILISLLLFGLSLVVTIPLLFGLLTWAVHRTKTRFDDDFFDTIKRELSWLVVVFIGRFVILRLDFKGEGLTTFVHDLFFVLIVSLLSMIGVRLVTFSANWFLEHRVPEENRKQLGPAILVLRWLGYLVAVLVALTLVAVHFGVNVSLLAPSFLLVGLIVGIIGVAGQTAITDTIHGFLILIDQPFRGGDDIEISGYDMPGEVLSIGLRTTRIRTVKNQEVNVPNSLIGTSQVINYSRPDPRYLIQSDFSVAGSDFDQVQQLIEKTVRGIEGVLPDKPVNVIYLAYGGTAVEIRVEWWIEDVWSRFPVQTRVFAALDQALDEAGIETPNPLHDLNVQRQDEAVINND